MDKLAYLPRLVDSKIQDYMQIFGAVCIEGPKWCGKTWTATFHSNSKIELGNPSGNFQNRKLAEMNPNLVLEGEFPRCIDEWQEVPSIWDAVRYKVDQTTQKGIFLLTGSSTPNHKGILHSGAGRIARIAMKPMSLYESGHSSGQISLKDICTQSFKSQFTGDVDLHNLIHLIIKGGWPGVIDLDVNQASLVSKEYIRAVIEDDVHRIDGIQRNKHKIELLLRSLARNECTTVSNAVLKKDIKEKDIDDIDIDTIKDYLDIFNRLYLTSNQKPFSANLRSSVRVKQSEKRHFVDPSLACALLNATPVMLMNDLETLGFLFESLCERDLQIYASTFDGELYHYQDYKNREVDAVIQMPNGDWCAFEIKLGANQIDKAANSLLSLKKSMEDDGAKAPSMLCVVCGLSNAAYLRDDGVYVVPITALKN